MVMLFASTYAVASQWMPEKYNLDNQLAQVSQISNTSFIGWEKVDTQSLVLQTTPSRYYLIVLSFPAFHLPFTEDIGISGQNLMIRPGYDNVFVRDATGRWNRHIIHKIYKFENRKQVREIVARLTGDTPVAPPKKSDSGEALLASRQVQFFNRF
jgi:hypothetical protein